MDPTCSAIQNTYRRDDIERFYVVEEELLKVYLQLSWRLVAFRHSPNNLVVDIGATDGVVLSRWSGVRD